MNSDTILPTAPAFLDPLLEIETCYYYAVPKFYSMRHPNTRWLIAMIKNGEEDRVKRKMDITPQVFKDAYFQLIDNPIIYLPNDPSASPLFKRKTVLYLTALGVSLYMKNLPMVEMLLSYRTLQNETLMTPKDPQYASHLQDTIYGDFHAFPPFVIMLRVCSFDCARPLMEAGWNPSESIAMPMRRKYERRAFFFYDWLDVALGILSLRSLYPLQTAMLYMTRDMVLYKPVKLNIDLLVPPKDAKSKEKPVLAVTTGLVDIDNVPFGTKILGVKSLMQMTEEYDRYLQMRYCAKQINNVKREALAVGLNPEILMLQVDEYDGGYVDPNEQQGGNNAFSAATNTSNHWQQVISVNNSARDPTAEESELSNSAIENLNNIKLEIDRLNRNTSAAVKKNSSGETRYASEACRVLMFANDKDKFGKSLQQCLDTLQVLTRRGFFSCTTRASPESARARDVRNIVVLLFNLIQREQVKVDKLVAHIKSGQKKFKHLEGHKLLENRKSACVQNMTKMIAILTKVLLQSKEIVEFVKSNFPMYDAQSVDFKFDPGLERKFGDIKAGVINAFNSDKEAWNYLTRDQMVAVNKVKDMEMHFKVGKKPTEEELFAVAKQGKRSAARNKNNMENTNSCFVTFKKVQRRKKAVNCSEIGSVEEGSLEERRSVVRNIEMMMNSEESMRSVFNDDFEQLQNSQATIPLSSTELMLSHLCKEVNDLFEPDEDAQEDSRDEEVRRSSWSEVEFQGSPETRDSTTVQPTLKEPSLQEESAAGDSSVSPVPVETPRRSEVGARPRAKKKRRGFFRRVRHLRRQWASDRQKVGEDPDSDLDIFSDSDVSDDLTSSSFD